MHNDLSESCMGTGMVIALELLGSFCMVALFFPYEVFNEATGVSYACQWVIGLSL
jgi:hypothetical protein